MDTKSIALLGSRVNKVMQQQCIAAAQSMGLSEELAQIFSDTYVASRASTALQVDFAEQVAEAYSRRGSIESTAEVKIHTHLTESEKTIMRSNFPNMKLDMSSGRDLVSHPLRHAQKKVADELIEKHAVGFKSRKEVGASEAAYIYHQNPAGHICVPMIDARDLSRKINAQFVLDRAIQSGGTPGIRALNLRNKVNMCSNLAQDCIVEADLIVARFSTYDMPFLDFFDAMNAAKARRFISIMQIPERIQYETDFYEKDIDCEISVNCQMDQIVFSGRGEMSLSYSHKYSNLLDYLHPRVVRTPHGDFFYRVQQRFGSMCVCIADRLYEPYKANLNAFYIKDIPQRVIVDSIYYDMRFDKNSLNAYVPITFTVPIGVWKETELYAVSLLNSAKFNTESIYRFLKSKSRAFTFCGVPVLRHEAVDYELFSAITMAAFLKVASNRNTQDAVCNRVLGMIKTRQNFAQRSIISRMLTQTVYGIYHFVKRGPGVLSMPIDMYLDRIKQITNSEIQQRISVNQEEKLVRLLKHSLFSQYIQRQGMGHETIVDSYRYYDGFQLNRSKDDFSYISNVEQVTFDKTSIEDELSLSLSPEIQSETFVADSGPTDQQIGNLEAINESSDHPDLMGDVSRSIAEIRNYLIEESRGKKDLAKTLMEKYFTVSDMGTVEMKPKKVNMKGPAYLETWGDRTQNHKIFLAKADRGVLTSLKLDSSLRKYFDKTNIEEVINHTHCVIWKDGPKIVPISMREEQDVKKWYLATELLYYGDVMFLSELEVFLNDDKINAIDNAPDMSLAGVAIEFYDAGPGTGKSRTLKTKATPQSLVLCKAKENTAELRRDLSKKFQGVDAFDVRNIRTIDSYLLHRNIGDFDSIHVDEALMEHSGILFTVMKYLMQELNERQLSFRSIPIFFYGDRQQIPFTNRIPKIFTMRCIKMPVYVIYKTIYLTLTWRCPLDATAIVSKYYEKGLTSNSNVIRSIKYRNYNRTLLESIVGSYEVILCYTRDEMRKISNMLRGKIKIPIMTIEQSQGKEWDKILTVRSDSAADIAYQSLPHVIVNITRHKIESMFLLTSPTKVGSSLLQKEVSQEINNLELYVDESSALKNLALE